MLQNTQKVLYNFLSNEKRAHLEANLLDSNEFIFSQFDYGYISPVLLIFLNCLEVTESIRL